jgi:hypothetical protein
MQASIFWIRYYSIEVDFPAKFIAEDKPERKMQSKKKDRPFGQPFLSIYEVLQRS